MNDVIENNNDVIADLEAIKGYMEWEMPLNFIITISSVIEKLKPKKPKRTKSIYKCSICGRQLRTGSGKEHKNRDRFCSECGQVIDWG